MEKQFAYQCECRGPRDCRLTVNVSFEEAKRLSFDFSIVTIVDECKNGPDEGYTLYEEKPGYKCYKVPGGKI